MNPTLQALAKAYSASAAGKRGAGRDFMIDYEKFLRDAGLDDGDDREMAERELVLAAGQSGGMLIIDRQSRSGLPERLRLAREGGEAWLFASIGEIAPQSSRSTLAAFFEEAGGLVVPEAFLTGWQAFFRELARRALAGESVQPFQHGLPSENAAFLRALHGVITWPHESLVRYASVRITGDSKKLEALRPRLEQALREISGDEAAGLESCGILQTPRSVTVHGPLVLSFANGEVDLGLLAGPVSISRDDLARATLRSTATICLTVENEGVFREIARNNPGVILIHTSFPGSATRLLLEKLPSGLAYHHFGDTDPAGFDILRDLRERTGKPCLPFLMQVRGGGEALGRQDQSTLERLLATPSMADLQPELALMKASGLKGSFEQEAIGIDVVIDGLRRLGRFSAPGG